MRIVTPETIDASVITSTNVVNDYADWTAGTYDLGDRAVEDNVAYEVVADPSTTDQPSVGVTADPPTWVRVGWSNQYRMFREGIDSYSSGTTSIDVTLTFAATIRTFAALGLQGNTAQLIVTDSVEGVVYDETIDLYQPTAVTWWEYYFLPYELAQTAVFENIPPYPNSTYQLIVSGDTGDEIRVGRVVAGPERELGVTNYGSSVSLQDYSIKERDGFGNLTLVRRRTVSVVDYDVTVPSARVDLVVRTLKRLSGTPTLIIGETNYNSTITFGVLQDVTQGIDYPSVSELTVRVEEF
jgi:hypothetical protein